MPVEVFVVDDVSTDNTIEELKKSEADGITSFKKNMGWSYAFKKRFSKSSEDGR